MNLHTRSGRLKLAVLALLALGAARHTTEALDPQHYLTHVKFLASDAMRGRATGSPELEKAAAYVAKQFKASGLQPLDGKGYLQAFPVTTNAKLGINNRFECIRMIHCKISKCLTVNAQIFRMNFSHQLRITHSMLACSRVDALDP